MIGLIFYLIVLFDFTKSFNLSPKFHTIINDPSFQDGSYFGYTVELRSGINGYSPSIVIGAPKANSSYIEHRNIMQPGVVYQCNIDKIMEINPSCYPLLLDPTGDVNDTTSSAPVKHHKGYSMLGFAIDGQTSRGGRFVACAPQWINQYYLSAKFILGNGICYWIPDTKDSNHTAEKLMPLIAPNRQSYIVKGRNNTGYAYGQAGFSVHMSKPDGSELLLGAPGIYNWKGGIIIYKDVDYEFESRSYLNVSVLNSFYNRRILRDSYFGYALGSGVFLKEFPTKRWYVSSAPRAKYKGRVYLFDYHENNHDYDIKKEFDGQQIGEYFGSGLCITDVNRDGLDDVIIGAPRYSLDNEFIETGDEGTVYVFLNLDNWHFQEQPKLQHIQETRAQFGSCISSIGDLDLDGYNDVVVGAPYEDDGRGSVYVYLGSKKGLKPKPSQHIRAINVDRNLYGFGISISKGVDIDNNFYNDLAVGSYLSDNVVIFKSQPVIRLFGKVNSSIHDIDLNTTELFVSACIGYNGAYLPENIQILFNIQADLVYKRAMFIEDKIFKNNLTKIVNVSVANEVCMVFPLKLKDFSEDFKAPLEIRMQYFLYEDRSKAVQSVFCSSCPVIDPRDENTAKLLVPYSMGCGSDKQCTPDLKLKASFMNISDVFIFGTDKAIYLNISVKNDGETAFLTSLHVTPLNELSFVQIPTYCNDQYQTIICELDNVLFQEDRTIIFELDAVNIDTNLEAIKINLTVQTSGDDQNETDNNILAVLPLMSVAELKIISKSIPEQLSFKDKKGVIKNKIDPISQEYIIQNLGPSPVGNSFVYFYFPISYDNLQLFNIMEPEASMSETQSIKCNASGPGFSEDFIGDNGDDFTLDDELSQVRIRRETIEDDILKTFYINESRIDLPINRTLFLNCSELSVNTICITVTCELGLLKTNGVIKFLIQPIFENIDEVLKYKDILHMDVNAVLRPLVKLNSVNNGVVATTLGTTLIGSLPTENIAHFWIALAIALGLLFLRFILSCLVKVGFFKRTMKHKLELLKQGSLMRRWSLSRRNSMKNEKNLNNNNNYYKKAVEL